MDQHLCIVFRFPFNKIGTIYSTSIYKGMGPNKKKTKRKEMSFWNVQTLTTTAPIPIPIPNWLLYVCISYVTSFDRKMRRTFDLLSFSSHLIFRIVIGVDMYIDVCYHCAIAECVLCFVCVRCGACDVNVWLCLFDLHKVYVYGCITNKGKIF